MQEEGIFQILQDCHHNDLITRARNTHNSQYPAMLPLIGIFRLLVLYGRLVVGMKPGKSPGRKRTAKTNKQTNKQQLKITIAGKGGALLEKRY